MTASHQPALTGRALTLVTIVLATGCGLTVANLYYGQPLLTEFGKTFKVGQSTASIVVTATQLGYALGLVLLLPLGDLLENRNLTSRMLIGTAAALLLAALSPTYPVFLTAAILIGMTSVVAQILVPYAAHLAPPKQRGLFVGRVMSGLLLGILLARTVSSLVASAWGWRSVYLISAALMLALSVLLWRLLPVRRPAQGRTYRSLLVSVGTLARTEPVLRRRSICQALTFGAFSAFWTSIAFELVHRHGLSQTGIGLFALVGAGGALAAPVAGWLGDRGLSTPATGFSLAGAAVAMAAAGLGVGNLYVLAAAGLLLDLAVQSHQVLSQRVIYALQPDARARVNAVFMGSVFTGGAIASAISGVLQESFGWTGVCFFGLVLPLLALMIWADGLRRAQRDQRH